MAVCDTVPALVTTADGHAAACWLGAVADDGAADGAGKPATVTLEGGSDD
jgi:hypothetical protein